MPINKINFLYSHIRCIKLSEFKPLRKLLCVSAFMLLVSGFSFSQNAESLTNSSIIRLVKAKLSDDIILDMINSSKVNFQLSPDSIKILVRENVSSVVLEAMKTAYAKQSSSLSAANPKPEITDTAKTSGNKDQINAVVKEKDTTLIKKEPVLQPITVQPKDTLKKQEILQQPHNTDLPKEKHNPETANINPYINQSFTIVTLSYVNPLRDLIVFCYEQCLSMTSYIGGWDIRIRKSLENEKNLMDSMNMIGKELINKKNADTRAFDNEISALKNKLSDYRNKHELLKTIIRTDGKILTKEIAVKKKEADQLISSKFSEISDKVKNSDPSPYPVEPAATFTVPKPKTGDHFVNHVAPLTVIPAFFLNEITSLQEKIVTWNGTVMEVIRQDSILRDQLQSPEKELSQYLSSPKEKQKENKKGISALKKQCDNLNKERKHLAKQMVADSKKLSDSLKVLKTEIQTLVDERFIDAIENIDASYQDKF